MITLKKKKKKNCWNNFIDFSCNERLLGIASAHLGWIILICTEYLQAGCEDAHWGIRKDQNLEICLGDVTSVLGFVCINVKLIMIMMKPHHYAFLYLNIYANRFGNLPKS